MGKKKNKKKKKQVKVEEYYALSSGAKKMILVIFLFALTGISVLSFMEMAGALGVMIDEGLGMIFGIIKFLFPVLLLLVIYAILKPNREAPRLLSSIGIALFYLTLSGLLHIKAPLTKTLALALDGEGGGLIGYTISYPMQTLLGFWGGTILLIAIMAASLVLLFNTTLGGVADRVGALNPFSRERELDNDEEDDYEEADEYENEDEEEDILEEGNKDEETTGQEVKLKRKGLFIKKSETSANKEKDGPESTTEKFADSKFKSIKIDLPSSLLSKKVGKPRSGDIDLAMERIESTLSSFGIEVEMDEVSVGPTVTQYTLKPAEGVKVSKITSLGNDLALALAAHPIRIEAPIPGRSLVGIEVPNQSPASVGLRQVIDSKDFKEAKSKLTLGLGKDVAGKAWSYDLAKMPHLLVAGATGSGKSVCLNSIIISLLYQNNPDMLRMILIDPKRVEFPVYNGIPHLLTPVITDVTKAVNSLRWAIQEMDQRFDLLSKSGDRNIGSYNKKAEDKMPYLVIVIDELADLMIAASNEIESSIIRLTQMARAVGIHLIVATQRPSVDVITGLIKANIPGRIAFSVASSTDSRTILDSVGAEKLIGKGDMLLQTADLSKPRRIQGAFISDDEIKRIVKFLKQAAGEPEYDEAVTKQQTGSTSFDFGKKGKGGSSGDMEDVLYEDAKDVVMQAGKASASYLQRRLRVGYARAARLIDLLEEAGIVSPADGARPRSILVMADHDEEPTPTIFKKEEAIEEVGGNDEAEYEDDEEDTDVSDDDDVEEYEEDNNEDEAPELAVT